MTVFDPAHTIESVEVPELCKCGKPPHIGTEWIMPLDSQVSLWERVKSLFRRNHDRV